MNEELAQCARLNFENLERALPAITQVLYYRIAKAQLDEALGGKTMAESLGPAKEIGRVEFNEDGTVATFGCVAKVTRIENNPEDL